MRLTVPEPKIKLYEDRFDVHDKLSRKPTGDKLSELVKRIDDPLVIALDGAWGSGKSLFLKCWVGEHLKREGNSTQTVYFDAFKHDFLDDPLIALTGAIAERFEETDETSAQKAWKKAKHVAPSLGRVLVRTGVSVATAGLVTKADELADVAINTVSSELDGAVAEFWKRENGKRAAMAAFRQALIDLTEPNDDGCPTRKLTVVIDELDRCRPDYALSLLEIIKHFFNVDGVHFILGVNLTELRNSVIARYGEKSDAQTYLQKFITLALRLPETNTYLKPIPIWIEYFQKTSEQMQFPDRAKPLLDTVEVILKSLRMDRPVSLRDAERVLTTLATIPRLQEGFNAIYLAGLATMAVFKVFLPEAYYRFRDNEDANFRYLDFFDKEKILSTHIGDRVELTWRAIQDFSTLTDEDKTTIRQTDFMFGENLIEDLLAKVSKDLLETFQFNDT